MSSTTMFGSAWKNDISRLRIEIPKLPNVEVEVDVDVEVDFVDDNCIKNCIKPVENKYYYEDNYIIMTFSWDKIEN